MKNLVLLATVLATALAAAGCSERAQMQRSVDAMNAQMPKKLDDFTTATKVELGPHELRMFFKISATFETDAATTEALRKGMVTQACGNPDVRKILKKGYVLVNHYDVPTPHGPGEFNITINPSDCP